MTACRDERGSVSLLLVVMVLGLLAAAGLVVDGGAKLRAVQQATAAAGEAARAATQQVNVPGVQHRGEARLTVPAARAAARDALADAGVTGTVTVTADQVHVDATVTRPTIFLALFGLHAVTGAGSATADLTIN